MYLSISVYHVLLECPITTTLFKKDGYDFTPCNSVIDILYNTDVIIPIAKLIVRSPVGKIYYKFSNIAAKKMNG